jgi:DNA-binding transcriptional LysR family regulator
MLRRLRRELPGVTLQLAELPSTEQLGKLAAGELDVGLVRQAITPEVVELRLIHRQRMVAALPSTHPLANQQRLGLSQLEGELFVTTPDRRSPALNARVRAACAAAGFQPRAALEVVEMATILSFVGEGLGVALVPASCRRFADRTVSLVDLEDTTEHLDLPLYLATRSNERDASVIRVAQAIKKLFAL